MVKKRSEIKKIVERYIAELKKYNIDIYAVFLYGSYAKGKQKEYSDIDIAVISSSFKKMDIFERQMILSKAHHNFGEPIEPIGFTPEQILKKRGFAREVIENGVVVYSTTK
ncbi:MAG: nucleotidyltransferase domain-containing protein [Thermodesulfovibrionales bacterium]|nr:nucleotidyltransferase domain-containing protein [Thermodesulfovibrionales bacterium]